MPAFYAVRLRSVLLILLLAAGVAAHGSDATTKPAPRDANWLKRHEAINKRAQEKKWDLVFIGDSITAGWGGAGKKVWQEHYAPRNTGNLGIGGDQTQHVLYRLENGNLEGQSPKLAVVMIGTNNLGGNRFEAPDTIEGVTAVVESIRQVSPETKILLLGVFPRGQAADDPYRAKIADTNRGISELADEQNIYYLDIGEVFLEEDGTLNKKIMPDYLHLSEEGYRRWAEAIEEKVAELMGERAPAGT